VREFWCRSTGHCRQVELDESHGSRQEENARTLTSRRAVQRSERRQRGVAVCRLGGRVQGAPNTFAPTIARTQEFAAIHADMHQWAQTREQVDDLERRFLAWVARFRVLHGAASITPYLHAVAAHVFRFAKKYHGIGKFNNQGVEGKNGQQTKECRRNVAYGQACLQIMQREHRVLLARWKGIVPKKRKYKKRATKGEKALAAAVAARV